MSKVQSIRTLLGHHMDALFNHSKWLDPQDWQILVGLSGYKKPVVPKEFKDKNRAEKLKVQCGYITALNPIPVKISKARNKFSFDVPGVVNTTAEIIHQHFDLTRRVDLVQDNLQEFDACGFPYDTIVTSLPTIRERVYSKSLFLIKPPPSDNPSGGKYFMTAAAEKGTYEMKKDDRPYYRKWLQPNPTPQNRIFTFDNLSDTYLQENFAAFDLPKDKVYLQIKVITEGKPDISILFMLHLNVQRFVKEPPGPDNALGRQALLVSGVGSIGNQFEFLDNAIKRYRSEKRKMFCTAWFFYSIEGSKQLSSFFTDVKKINDSVQLGNHEQVIDPQHMLQRLIGRSLNDVEEQANTWKYMDWVKELIRTQFSEHWVTFRNHELGAAVRPDREKLFLKELREEVKKAQGPLKDKLAKFLKDTEDDTSLYLIRRGTQFTKYDRHSRIAGSDDYYVYLWNNKTRLFTRFPMSFLWLEIGIGHTVEDIYERTKGLVPLSKIVVWGGLAVMTFGIFGSAAVLTHGFRAYLGDKIRGLSAETLARLTGLYTDLKRKLLAFLFESAMSLLPLSGDNLFLMGLGLIRGLLRGYSEDTFEALFKKWNAVAMLEPSTIRTIKMLQRVESALRTVDEKMSQFKNKVDDKTSRLLAQRFIGTSVDLLNGFVSLLNNLYFLEYDQVKEYLNIATEANGAPPVTKEQWDQLRHNHFVKSVITYDKQIRDAGKSVKEIYDDVQSNIGIIQNAVKGVEFFMLFEALNGGLLVTVALAMVKPLAKPKVIGAVAVAGAGTLVILRGFDQAIKDIGGVLKSGLAYFVGEKRSVERIERLGELIGQLIGGYTINKAMFGDATWTERFKKDGHNPLKFMGKAFLRNELKVGLLMPGLNLALFNYVFLIEKVIKISKTEYEGLLKEFDKIIYGDPTFKDLMPEDRTMTLDKALRLVNAAEKTLAKWLRELANKTDLNAEINKMVAYASKLKPGKMPSFQDIRDGKDIVDWSKDAFIFLVLSHLHASLKRIADGFHGLQANVSPDKDISVMSVLNMLGFLQNGQESDATLDTGFDEIFLPEK